LRKYSPVLRPGHLMRHLLQTDLLPRSSINTFPEDRFLPSTLKVLRRRKL
jgi:hypothetical protein